MLQDVNWPLGNALINALITLTAAECYVEVGHNNRITETGWERISRSRVGFFFHFLCFKNNQVDFQAALLLFQIYMGIKQSVLLRNSANKVTI